MCENCFEHLKDQDWTSDYAEKLKKENSDLNTNLSVTKESIVRLENTLKSERVLKEYFKSQLFKVAEMYNHLAGDFNSYKHIFMPKATKISIKKLEEICSWDYLAEKLQNGSEDTFMSTLIDIPMQGAD